jgi:hypothetical protein
MPTHGACFYRQRSLQLSKKGCGERFLMIGIQRGVIPTPMIVFEFQVGNSSKSGQGHSMDSKGGYRNHLPSFQQHN